MSCLPCWSCLQMKKLRLREAKAAPEDTQPAPKGEAGAAPPTPLLQPRPPPSTARPELRSAGPTSAQTLPGPSPCVSLSLTATGEDAAGSWRGGLLGGLQEGL